MANGVLVGCFRALSNVATPPEQSTWAIECATSWTSPTGNVTSEEVLRQAFPSVRLESFPSEAEMVAKLSVRKNAVGLANNYGVVFEWAEQG
ncbi:hypothetical protein HPB51_026979 [Rhipicephalus microplus]|uniref:Uncharacterized protein n=1 Tax=Rhipicephalus microplus TaxID=6941 RepID=A0A9J6D1L9_RHIMP|nr:hypothetical protein HPB51_026979 [Rhipicephalus microplus]